MRIRFQLIAVPLVAAIACSPEYVTNVMTTPTNAAIRVVNAGVVAVNVVTDDGGTVGTVQPGQFSAPLGIHSGARTVSLARVDGAGAVSLSVTIAAGDTVRFAAQKNAAGAMTGAVLGDSGAVPAPGMGKLRVMHMSPTGGTLQLWRIQPDYAGKVPFVTPFNYLANSGFVQSTPGTWQLRLWATPADSTGWNTAMDSLNVVVSAGFIRTVVVLDKAGGGQKLQLLY